MFDAKDGKIEFLTAEVGVTLKPLSFAVTLTDGTTLKVSGTPTAKVTLKPDYKKLAQWFLEEAAKRIGAEAAVEAGLVVALVGGAVLTGLDYIDLDRRELSRCGATVGRSVSHPAHG